MTHVLVLFNGYKEKEGTDARRRISHEKLTMVSYVKKK
jgi:hypothetical protein